MIKDRWNREIFIMMCISAMVLALLIAASKVFVYPEAGTGEYRLVVIDTSDVHGGLAGGEEPNLEYRMAFIADKVNDARRTEDGIDSDRVVLLDGGDIFQGSALSRLSKGEAMSAVYDEMEYDAVTIGNHEFDWGIDMVIDEDQTMRDYEMDGKKCKNDIPVICSNLYKDGKKVDFADDYVILEKKAVDESGEEKNVRIGVIGFAEDFSKSNPDKVFKDLGYVITADYDEANRLAEELSGDKRCDAVIVLAHGDPRDVAEGLGDSTDVDLVLGGHIHKEINKKTDWGLRYMSPSGSAYTYLYDELVFENDGKGGVRIKEGADDRAEIVKTAKDEEKLYDNGNNSEELDPEAVDITNDYYDRIRPYLEKEIGYITEPVTRTVLDGSGNRVSVASNFICDAMRRGADVEVAFTNKSGVRADLEIPEGSDRRTVTQLDMYSMLPFDDRMYVYELTYGDLLDVLSFGMNGGGWTLLTCMTGIDCYFKVDPASDPAKKYKDSMVDALVKDGELIYHDGRWREGWKEKKVRVGVVDFAAEAEKTKQGKVNPLHAINETDQLLENDRPVRDYVIEGFEAEAAENNGHLHTDDRCCYRFMEYDGADDL